MAVGKDTTRVVAYISSEDKEILEQIAKSVNRNVSNYIGLLIKQDIERHKK